ncbi:MAG TPA: hypothetical protein VN802_01935 [Stellaceae bacterium]|nr:hypothetical protein [Stellaceae bacterium]
MSLMKVVLTVAGETCACCGMECWDEGNPRDDHPDYPWEKCVTCGYDARPPIDCIDRVTVPLDRLLPPECVEN